MPKTRLVRQLRHGQVTIPKEFRDALDIAQDDLLAMTLDDGRLEIAPVKVQRVTKGSPYLRELYELFAPMRESLRDVSDEEIDAAIDDALREVRAEKRR